MALLMENLHAVYSGYDSPLKTETQRIILRTRLFTLHTLWDVSVKNISGAKTQNRLLIEEKTGTCSGSSAVVLLHGGVSKTWIAKFHQSPNHCWTCGGCQYFVQSSSWATVCKCTAINCSVLSDFSSSVFTEAAFIPLMIKLEPAFSTFPLFHPASFLSFIRLCDSRLYFYILKKVLSFHTQHLLHWLFSSFIHSFFLSSHEKLFSCLFSSSLLFLLFNFHSFLSMNLFFFLSLAFL